MKAIILNCSLKTSDHDSSNQTLAKLLAFEFEHHQIKTEIIRIADYNIPVGVETKVNDDDAWPGIRQKILDAEILIMASPTWVGRMSSLAQKCIERMDAMLSETDAQDRPVAYNHVAGFLATGNEDGAKHVIAEMEAALLEIGFTVPGQAWAYFNQGSSIGPAYIEEDSNKKKERTQKDIATMANNIARTANALQQNPLK